MTMPGRNYTATTSYRYGFNGKENDKNIGEGVQDYGMRIYDSRIGKFLSVDPLTREYSFYTPYQFAGNSPIWATDLDGAEPTYFNESLKAFKSFYDTYLPLYQKAFSKEDRLKPANQFSVANITLMKAFLLYNYYARTTSCNGYCPGSGKPPYPGSVTLRDEGKYGWYDCITTIIASLKIIYNDFNGKSVPRSADGFTKKLIENRLVEKTLNVGFTKNGKDISSADRLGTPNSLPDATNAGEILRKDVNNKEGSYMYVLTYFDELHTALLEVKVDKDNNMTFTLMDETKNTGGQKVMNMEQFNKYMVDYANVELNTYDSNRRPTGKPDKNMSTHTKLYRLKPKK